MKKSVYEASLKSLIGPILSTPKCTFPSVPIYWPYPYSIANAARRFSRIAELICAVPAVSSSAWLAQKSPISAARLSGSLGKKRLGRAVKMTMDARAEKPRRTTLM